MKYIKQRLDYKKWSELKFFPPGLACIGWMTANTHKLFAKRKLTKLDRDNCENQL